MPRTLMLQDVAQDLRVCLRSLSRAPVLTLTILLTVGLGIGATTAIFAAVNAALLRPLPYPDPERLVRVYTDAPPFQWRFSAADYLALQDQQTQFERIAYYTDRRVAFSDGQSAEVLRGRQVSPTYFATLRMVPAAGRDFGESDGRPGEPPAVIVSHGFWLRRLGGRADAIGQTIRLDGAEHTVIGVLPRRVGPLERGQEFFVAAQLPPPRRKGPFFYTVVARLKDGVDPSAAASELHAINRRIFPLWKASYQDDKATWDLTSLKDFVVGDVGKVAGLALASVALVWLIACGNASSLLVARVASRRGELAVRAALGASRGRVVRHLLGESAVLAAGSLAFGLGIAWACIQVLRGVGAGYFPRMEEVSVDARVSLLMVALALMSALIFGLVPALSGTRVPVAESLRSSTRSSTGNLAVRRLRLFLVGSQFAVATPLLVVAGLLLASLDRLGRVDLGFDPHNVLTGSIRLPSSSYALPGQAATFWDEAERRLAALPGIAKCAFADSRPPDGAGNINNFDLEEAPTPPGQSQPATPWVAVTPGYFDVLGVKLLEGRLLEERDALPENLESVVVDRAWARRFFPGRSALGKRFREGGCTTCPWTSVVGVVGEVKYAGLDRPDEGTVYAPLDRASLSRFLVLRTRTDPVATAATVRRVIHDLEPSAPLSNVATVEELAAESLTDRRSLSVLVGSFALVALLLSVVGIYGVMNYYVQQHLKEIGIRLALGGRSLDVFRLVVGQGARVVAGGIAAGLLAALVLTRLIAALLFGVGAADPLTFTAVGVLLLALALVVCMIPAAFAVRVQPASVLRND